MDHLCKREEREPKENWKTLWYSLDVDKKKKQQQNVKLVWWLPVYLNEVFCEHKTTQEFFEELYILSRVWQKTIELWRFPLLHKLM